MQDEWFRCVELPISWEQFHRLPRNAAYKYEYFNDKAWLSPRPRFCHALLRLRPCESVTEVDAQWTIGIRPLRDADWKRLAPAFSGAFSRVTPFSSMGDKARRRAARECLNKTRTGGDGPLVRQACFVAVSAEDEKHTVGAILVTLAPDRDLTDWHSCKWPRKPPRDAVKRRHGVGTALLSNATAALLKLGYEELSTTFLAGNEWSMLWHWRNGFELLEYPGSLRQIRRQIREAT